MRIIRRVLLPLAAMLLCLTLAFAEQDMNVLSHWLVTDSQYHFPDVIDRYTDPEAWSGFSFAEDSELLEIWFPLIHDADAAVLTYKDEVWMIDCGDEKAGAQAAALLQQLKLDHVDRIINTHPHHDHLNGLSKVDEVAKVEELWICFAENSTDTMEKAMRSAELREIEVLHYGDEDVLTMGEGEISLQVWMKTPDTASMNDRSAQIRLCYGERSILFMADMEQAGQRALLQAVSKQELSSDIIKYPHHGKSYMVNDFLNAVNPVFAIVTNYANVGEAGEYLTEKDISYANTTQGYVHLVTDGKHWLTEQVDF